jgi:predicted HTH transcriptional regulator
MESKASSLLEFLIIEQESEWVEFKHNKADPAEIGRNISALSNSATLCGREYGYIVWGVGDTDHTLEGTTFDPQRAKKGNEPLENWLLRGLHPQVNFEFIAIEYGGKNFVILQIPSCKYAPVRFEEHEHVRIGGTTKSLKNHPEKERELWKRLQKYEFETEIARGGAFRERSPLYARHQVVLRTTQRASPQLQRCGV